MRKNNKFHYQRGFALTTLVLIIGAVSLALTGEKVAEHVIEKNTNDRIAESFNEQAQHLAKNAADMGESGDEAVRESLRLREAAKQIEEHGRTTYKYNMIKEAGGLAKGLGTGKLVGAVAGGVAQGLGAVKDVATAVSDASGVILDANGIQKAYNEGRKPEQSESDLKLYELIKGSRDNVDELELAMLKATTDNLVASYKATIKEGAEISDWIAIREAQIKELEEGEQRRAAARLKLAADQAARKAIQKANQTGNMDWDDVFNEVAEEMDTKRNRELIDQVEADPTPTPQLVHRQVTGRGSWGSSSFSLSFHSKGGSSSGSIGGLCSGSTSGSYTFDGEDGGRISGSMGGSCGSGELRCSASGSFSGTIYLKKGYASGRWGGSCDEESLSGGWSVSFTPLEERVLEEGE